MTVKKILKIAKSQIGYKESPPNSNKTKYGKAYGLNGRPWCVIFIWYLFYVGKAEKLFYDGKKTAYAPDLWKWFKKIKRATKKIEKAKPGDIVFFDFNANGIPDHVGIVEKVLTGGYVQTIEGNTGTNNTNGGQVQRRKRHKSVILGFGRPKYKEDPKKKKIDYNKLPELKKGSHGAAVKKVQKILKITIDGIYGSQTEKAVKKFQAAHKLINDGIVGPKTWKALLTKK